MSPTCHDKKKKKFHSVFLHLHHISNMLLKTFLQNKLPTSNYEEISLKMLSDNKFHLSEKDVFVGREGNLGCKLKIV